MISKKTFLRKKWNEICQCFCKKCELDISWISLNKILLLIALRYGFYLMLKKEPLIVAMNGIHSKISIHWILWWLHHWCKQGTFLKNYVLKILTKHWGLTCMAKDILIISIVLSLNNYIRSRRQKNQIYKTIRNFHNFLSLE